MELDIRRLVGVTERSETRFRMDDGTLVILCTKCTYTPVPGSDECIGCMVDSMAEHGSSDRIILRTGKDIEVSGRSCRVLREVASLKRWSMQTRPLKNRCSRCPVSRNNVMSAVWTEFPRNCIEAGRAMLTDHESTGEECIVCRDNTERALEHLEHGLDRIMGSMRPVAGRRDGV